MIVVDTSVAVKWFIEEPGRDQARQLLDGQLDLIAPDFAIAEVANALWRKQRLGDIDAMQVDEAVRYCPLFFKRLVPASSLALDALRIAREISHSVYDCMFLALAGGLQNGSLLTADERFITKLDMTPYKRFLRPLMSPSLAEREGGAGA